LEPLKRKDHQIIDLGRYSLQVGGDDFSRVVFAGQCHYVSDPAAFNTVLAEIYELETYFPEQFRWGPYGTTSASEPCE